MATINQIYERENLRRMLQEIYLAKILRFVPPIPGPFKAGPQPEPPTMPSIIASQNLLIGELLVHALGDPNPQPNISTIINEMKKDNLHIEVLEGLIRQFESGTKALKSELDNFKKSS